MTYAKPESEFRIEGCPSPGTLLLVQGFLNTWSDELGIEDLKTPGSTEEWLRNAGLWARSSKLTKNQHTRLVRFRDRLRIWIVDKDQPKDLNDLLSEMLFRIEISPDGAMGLKADGDACDSVLGRLLEAIFDSMRAGTWDRLKCCDLPTCGWAFYDPTRSRTKRWCSMRTCGSRHKSREYYKRLKNHTR